MLFYRQISSLLNVDSINNVLKRVVAINLQWSTIESRIFVNCNYAVFTVSAFFANQRKRHKHNVLIIPEHCKNATSNNDKEQMKQTKKRKNNRNSPNQIRISFSYHPLSVIRIESSFTRAFYILNPGNENKSFQPNIQLQFFQLSFHTTFSCVHNTIWKVSLCMLGHPYLLSTRTLLAQILPLNIFIVDTIRQSRRNKIK